MTVLWSVRSEEVSEISVSGVLYYYIKRPVSGHASQQVYNILVLREMLHYLQLLHQVYELLVCGISYKNTVRSFTRASNR